MSLRRLFPIAAATLVATATVGCGQVDVPLLAESARTAALDGVDSVDPNDCGEGPMIVPDDYVYKLVVQPQLAGLGRIVRSQSGRVYFMHGGVGGGLRVSELDVDADRAAPVLEVAPWQTHGAIIGGPGDSFFIDLGGVIQQVWPDGTTSVWGRHYGPMPWVYTPDGRMLAIGAGGTSVVELASDGSTTDVLTGLVMVYDIAAASDGDLYVADFAATQLIELAPDGTHRVLATIAPDNTDLVIDGDDNLYLNNAAAGFARVDRTTGALTPMHASGAPCHVVQSPADIVFDDAGRAVFAAWVESRITWVDFDADTGGVLRHGHWANNTATALGADDAFYVGVPGCGAAVPSEIARLTAAGASEVFLGGRSGSIDSIDFDSDGGLYVASSSETGVGVHRYDPTTGTVSLVPDTTTYDISSLAWDATHDRLLVGSTVAGAGQVVVREYRPSGLQSTYTVGVTKAFMSIALDLGPDGTVYGFGVEADRFFTGPVDHYVMRLELGAGSSDDLFVYTRQGCCPAANFSVDGQGHAWVILNPDFRLYDVDPDAGATLFACNTPLDALGVHRTSQGDILLNSPEGLYRIWAPTPSERVELLIDDVDLLAYYGELDEGRRNALVATLAAAASSLEWGQTVAAENQLGAFVRQVSALVRAGRLDEARADGLITGVGDIVGRL